MWLSCVSLHGCYRVFMADTGSTSHCFSFLLKMALCGSYGTDLNVEMQRLQPWASPKWEILPPGPPSKLETHKNNEKCAQTSRARSAKSLAAGVQLCSGVLDALWCNLSIILGAFYPTNVFIYFLLLMYNLFSIKHNLSGRKSNSSGRPGDFGKFASRRESWSLWRCDRGINPWLVFLKMAVISRRCPLWTLKQSHADLCWWFTK